MITALLTNRAYGYPTRGAKRRRRPTILACLHQTANDHATARQERADRAQDRQEDARGDVVVRNFDIKDEEDDQDERERGSGADPGRGVDIGPASLCPIVPTLIAHAGAVGRSMHRRGAVARSGRGRRP